MRWVQFSAAAAAAAMLGGLSTPARAGNGTHPRTPVLWEDVPCMTVVDRSSTPVSHIPYDIPYEDTEVTPDEVEDSRRHQFLAFCRDFHPQSGPPNWISTADVEAAAAKDLEGSSTGDEDILETSSSLKDCWTRIIGDDERRPITFAMAEEGVDWDTTGIPAGTYVVYGYTWEPPFNLWSPRPGVIKVVDDPDPAASGPAAAVEFSGEAILYRDQTGELQTCVDAMQGTTVTGSWSIADTDPSWTTFIEDHPVQTGMNTLEFPAPPEAEGKSIMIRLVVEDPEGRTYTSYFRDLVVILKGDDPNDCSGTGIFDDPGCGSGTTTDTTGTDSTDGDTTTGTQPGTDPGASGSGSAGGCHVVPTRGNRYGLPWLLALLPMAGFGRRLTWRARANR